MLRKMAWKRWSERKPRGRVAGVSLWIPPFLSRREGNQTVAELVERQQLPVRRANKSLGRQLEITFRTDHVSRDGASREESRADESRWPPLLAQNFGVPLRIRR